MDRVPQPGMPEEPESPQEALRKKRLLKRLRGFLAGEDKQEPKELDLAVGENAEESDAGELWSRNEEAEEPEAYVPRLQQLGRNVLAQTHRVYGFAESVGNSIRSLPVESRAVVEPEAERLQEATGELKDSAEELKDELENLDQTQAKPEPGDAEATEAAEALPADESEPYKPEKDRSDAMGMARLVIATLIGGGLGALMGEGKKEKSFSKERAKMSATVEKQKVKMAEQEAELQQLKAAKPEVGAPQKEYVKKAAELAERQAELTQTTVEQVRVAAKAAGESEITFKIPERQAERATVERQTEASIGAEKLREQTSENRDSRGGHEQVVREVAEVGIASSMQASDDQKPAPRQPSPPIVPTQINSRVWVYWALLAFATVVAVGLILFGPR